MEYRVLGPLEVRDGDRSLPLAGAKQRALLALLLVHANHVLSRDKLIDELWGDEPPETAVQSLQVYISRLRKLLPPDTLLTRPPGYLVELETEELDLRRFERFLVDGREALAQGDPGRASRVLHDALALWRGPALAEFAFEPFAQAEIGRLEDLRLAAVEERIEADLALGRHADLIGELEALVAENPYRERLRGQLMLALYQSGRQTEALAAYRAARHDLVDELGIEPSEALQQLEKEILTHDERLEAPPRSESVSSRAPPAIERKLVTVVFADLAIRNELEQEPERAEAFLEAVHRDAQAEIEAAGGTVEKGLAGSLLATFAPSARQEDHALRAVSAALATRNRLEGAFRDELSLRMGVESGEVTVGRPGSFVSGVPVAAAARLIRTAQPGQIIVGTRAAAATGGAFQLKGRDDGYLLAAPTPIYRRPLTIGALAGVVAAAIAIPLFAFGGNSGMPSISAIAANSLGIVDPASGTIEAQVTSLPAPTRVAADAHSVWVTSAQDNSVSRIDAESRQLRQTIPVGNGPTGVAVGAGDVWVANSLDGTVSRIDPDANRVVQVIHVGNNPSAVAFGNNSIWVTNVDDETVSRIDPRTGKVVKTIGVGAAGRGVTAGGGAVWISDSARNRVVRVDAATNTVTQTIGVGSGPTAISVGAEAVWVANTLDGTLSRIDPVSNQVRETIPVGASPDAVAADAVAVWVANEAGRTLVQVDPKGGTVERTVQTGSRPTGLALADSLWVAAQESVGTHKGGRLRVDLHTLSVKNLDPATAYDPISWGILSTTNDGLTGFKRVGGSEGAQLVPDLATSLPTPTNGGKTYSFQLRKGIRYSTGASLKASDVRSSFERLYVMHSPRLDYYSGIVGAAHCAKAPRTCDLSGGIVVDDRAGTVTFHLTKPDAEFLYKLAIPFAYVSPPARLLPLAPVRPGCGTCGLGISAEPERMGTVAATGPYQIARHNSTGVRLVRNRNFRTWSAIATPDGYPDEIDVSFKAPFGRAAADLEANRIDLLSARPSPRLAQFETQHPAQVHTTPDLATSYLFLNTASPPFNSVRARRAVAYALDRGALLNVAGESEGLVNVGGGGEAAQVTCQVLPPNLGGYRPYCPYTLKPGTGGAWSGPDIQKARALVHASGTAGAHVAFWFYSPTFSARQSEVIRALLTSLGYRTSVRSFTDSSSYIRALAKAPRTQPQAGINGWFADYPAPSNFFSILSCRTANDPTANPSLFCSRSLDHQIDRALALQSQDQAAAATLWTEVDRKATNAAAIVPMYTLRSVDLVSKRVGNYQHHPLWGVLLDQLWVQ